MQGLIISLPKKGQKEENMPGPVMIVKKNLMISGSKSRCDSVC